jgi:EAL domain-containing protein (putative c-di-GMP-specific phosphodiesterase class I)
VADRVRRRAAAGEERLVQLDPRHVLLAQGFLFARPLPAPALASLLAEQAEEAVPAVAV